MDKTKKIIAYIFVFAFLATLLVILRAGKIFSVIKSPDFSGKNINEELKLFDEPGRVNIAVFGIRGKDDPNGGLLTDTIMVLSYKEEGSKMAVISIPRDIYIEDYPGRENGEKINAAYAFGEEKESGYGIEYAKNIVAKVLGLKIHYGIVVTFKAFEDLINALGGIDVLVEKPLRENLQWGDIDFFVPAGRRHMDGETALYYARSRFTTNDFDRGKRQQEIIMALREKSLRIGILANPFKINEFFSIVEKNVKTDMEFMEIINFLSFISRLPSQNIIHKVISDQDGDLLYSAKKGDAYILLPKGGNFEKIMEMAKNIL